MIAYKQNSSPVKVWPAKSGQSASVVTVNNPILDEHAATIKKLGKRVTEDIIEIGRLLTESKKILGHGNFLPWVEREFKWSASSVERFMQVYELSGKFVNLTNLEVPITGLYLLAAPSVPDEARTEMIERAESGESISNSEIKALIDRYREPETTAPKLPASSILRPAWADGKVAPPPDHNAPIAAQPDPNAPFHSPLLPPLPASIPRPAWAGGNAADPEDAAAERMSFYAEEEERCEDNEASASVPALPSEPPSPVSLLRDFIKQVRAIANEANTAAFDDVVLTNNARSRLRKAISNIRGGLADLSAVADLAERNAAKAGTAP